MAFKRDDSGPTLTAEGHRVYETAVEHIRNQLAQGNTYEQACDTLTGIEQEMKQFIVEDFLKILIAEEHFGSGVDIDDMALYLGMPYEELEDAMMALLRDKGFPMHHKIFDTLSVGKS